MAERWIAYVGHMQFPWGQAASRRVYGNAMSLVQAGRRVIVASGSERPRSISPLDVSATGGSLAHVGLGLSPKPEETSWQKANRLLFQSSAMTIRWLDAQQSKPSHVILYGSYTPYLIRLLPWCRRNRIPLLADIVEWHSPSQHSGGIFSLSNLNISLAMRCLYPQCDGIISISSYLSRYYRQRGCPVVQVPPTVDMSDVASPEFQQSASSDRLTLIYAGDPGKKDLLHPVIEGIKEVDPGGARVRLIVLGPTVEQVRTQCCDGGPLPDSVEVLGRVSQDEVAKILRNADFSVLLRPQMRFANAGFPTKFVESMANGVPVIANLTSDLGDYLHDGTTGFVCRDHTAKAFSEALGRALSLSAEARWKMRQAAHEQATTSFDYRHYAEPLLDLLDKVQ